MTCFPVRLLLTALLACTFAGEAASAQTPDATQAPVSAKFTLRGTVKAGNIPLPGVSVIAVDSANNKFSAATDENGTFQMRLPANLYNVRAALTAFASDTQTIQLEADQNTDFSLQLASRAKATTQDSASAVAARGTQSLSLLNGDSEESASSETATDPNATLPGISDTSATDSVAVNGQMGSTNSLGGMSEDEIHQRVQEAIDRARASGAQPGDIASSVGGMLSDMMGGGGFSGGQPSSSHGDHSGSHSGGKGSFRSFNPTQPHGSIFYVGGNSALNTQKFSPSRQATAAPSYNSNTYGVTLAGSPYIPGLFKPSTKQFVFLNLTGKKSSTQSVYDVVVPTDAQRNGDFSAPGNNPLYIQNSPTPTTVLTCAAGTGATCITPQAAALLNYYPHANVIPDITGDNYQRIVSPASDSNTIAMRYIRNFGQAGGMGSHGFSDLKKSHGSHGLRQNLNGNFNYQHAGQDEYTPFPAFGGSQLTNSLAFGAGYTIGYGHLSNNLSLTWNRTHAITHNYFTGRSNPATDAGLTLGDYNPSAGSGAHNTQLNPLNFGIPSVSFAQFAGFSDTTPADDIKQTISFSENSSYSHHHRNLHFGFDFRRIHYDTLGGTGNILGKFTFSDYSTCQLVATPSGKQCAQKTGSDFADFLLGLPQRAEIQASNFKYYLRANVWDFYVQDDWRILPNVTLNYGLRYEYFSPYIEKYNRLSTLSLAFNSASNPPLTGATQVKADSLAGTNFPRSLVNPDRNNFSPRIGIAWKPGFKFTKGTVIRAGYGVNYNTSQYSAFALRLASEPPYADTQTNIANPNYTSPAPGCGQYLTWTGTTTANTTTAFNCSGSAISNNYAVNPNYRLGYVQVWNLSLQQTLPLQTIFSLTYTGSKGTRLDMVRAPNRSVTGTAIANVDAFNYEDSVGGSHLGSLTASLNKRLQHGVALGATYTYSHSIDNASSIGGTAIVVAQNDQNLRAEEGNSAFDVRHQVAGTWLFELPFGPNTLFLNSGNLFSRIVQGWSLSGKYAFATGMPLTPHYSNSSSEIARGSSGSYRPNRISGVPVNGNGSYLHYLNNYTFFTGNAEANNGQCSEVLSTPIPANCPFTQPALNDPANPLGYGNASRNSITGPGVVTIDASLSKTVQLGSTRSLEMRAQADNVFNTVQYAGVDTNLNSHTFGQINKTTSSRQITVLARFRF